MARSPGRAATTATPQGEDRKQERQHLRWILRSALDGSPYFLTAYKASGKKVQALANFRATEGLSKFRTFRYDIFESAVLSQLKELNLRDIGTNDKPNRVEVLTGERTQLEADIRQLEGELEDGGEIPSIVRVLRRKEARLIEVAKDEDVEKQKAANPVAQSLGEMKTLSDLLENSPNPTDTRLRLRAALRRLVADARLLVVGNGPIRMAAVQFYFAAGSMRSYLIVWRPACAPRGNFIHSASMKVVSFASAAIEEELDLRDHDHAKRLEAELTNLPVDALKAMLAAVEKPDKGETAANDKPKRKRKAK
jgi:hypothetical protein